jgi:hypothetical protein
MSKNSNAISEGERQFVHGLLMEKHDRKSLGLGFGVVVGKSVKRRLSLETERVRQLPKDAACWSGPPS